LSASSHLSTQVKERQRCYTEAVTPPYRQPGANVAFWALIALAVVGEWAIRIRSLFNRGGDRSDRLSLFVVAVGLAAGVYGGVLVANRDLGVVSVGRWPLFVLGLLLMGTGIAVRWWSVVTLGRWFTVDVRVHAEQQVVTRGPYRWVRHPSYSGLIIVCLGIGMALDDWVSFALLAVLPTAGLVVRIRVEERALLAGIGEPYRRFAAGRARLLPRVW
jgi:protein-S-isoprenylcysteine O-methyltransferase Ste14